MIVPVSTICTLLLLIPWLALTEEIYRWQDEQGRLHFTDNLSTVPESQINRVIRHEWDKSISRPPSVESGERTLIPYRGEGKAITLPAHVNGRLTALFLLDTCATYTQITKNDALMLDIDFQSSPMIRTWVADGRFVRMPKVTIRSIRVGSLEVKDLEVLVGEVRLLGLNFLRQFHMMIDSSRGQIILERHPPWKMEATEAVSVEVDFLVKEMEINVSDARLDILSKKKRIELLLH